MIALLAAWILPAIAIARRNVFIALIYFVAASLSVPGLLSIDIGQPEVFLYALAIGAFYYLDRRPYCSVVLLGLAIAIKPYMALFVIILLFRKQYKFAVWSILVAGIVNLLRLCIWSTAWPSRGIYGPSSFTTAWVTGQVAA